MLRPTASRIAAMTLMPKSSPSGEICPAEYPVWNWLISTRNLLVSSGCKPVGCDRGLATCAGAWGEISAV